MAITCLGKHVIPLLRGQKDDFRMTVDIRAVELLDNSRACLTGVDRRDKDDQCIFPLIDEMLDLK